MPRSHQGKGGRPAFGHALMFKILLLQAMHALSDERAEYLIKDRLSFMRFLGLGLADPVPDANTIWTFRQAVKRAGAMDAWFARYGGGEGGDQEGQDPAELGEQAGQAPPEGSRCALGR